MAVKPTFRETIYRKLAYRRRGQELQRLVRFSFPYHEVNDDERLEGHGPCRVPQSVLEGTKYLGDTSFARMSGYKDVFYVFRLWGGELHIWQVSISAELSCCAAAAD